MSVQHDNWECFRDAAYYDMWCVRQVGERVFGQGFHLISQDEAKDLCDLLNTRPADSEARALLEKCSTLLRGAPDPEHGAQVEASVRAYLTRTAEREGGEHG